MPDIAGLIAPRPLFAESGKQDPIFPIAGSMEAFEKTHKIYEAFGAPDKVQHEIFDGPHEFHGVKGLPFLAASL
jgi:hypothetical protein